MLHYWPRNIRSFLLLPLNSRRNVFFLNLDKTEIGATGHSTTTEEIKRSSERMSTLSELEAPASSTSMGTVSSSGSVEKANLHTETDRLLTTVTGSTFTKQGEYPEPFYHLLLAVPLDVASAAVRDNERDMA